MVDRYEDDSLPEKYETSEGEDYSPIPTQEEVSNQTILIGSEYNGVTIDNELGIMIKSAANQVLFNASKGIEITRNSDGAVIFSVDSVTGNGVFSGQISASRFDIAPYDVGNGSFFDISLDYTGLQTSEVSGVNRWKNLIQQGYVLNKKFTSGILKYETMFDAWTLEFNDYQGTTAYYNQAVKFDSALGMRFVINGVDIATILNDKINAKQLLQINANQAALKLMGTTHVYQELFATGGTRSGWFGYGTSGSNVMTVRNEIGDITIQAGTGNWTYFKNLVDMQSNTIQNANLVAIKNTGDGLILQSDNSTDAFNTANIAWKTSGGTLVGRAHVNGSSFATTTMQFEVSDETGTGAVDLLLELNAAGANWAKVNGDLYPYQDNNRNLGSTTLRWKQLYAFTSTINTSDERAKQQISLVPDSWLDAWSEVDFIRYKFNEAVEEKGDAARWHVGVIAQRIQEAFERHGVDAFETGILGYDEWIDDAGIPQSLYSIRPDECQFLEMALLRRELNLLKKGAM